METPEIRVLVLADDAETGHRVRTSLVERLDHPYDVDHVRRLSAAQDRVRSRSYGAILVDIALSEHEGLEAVRALSVEAPAAPIIVLVPGNHGVGRKAISLGAQDCLTKEQLAPGSLHRSLAHAMDRHAVRHRLQKHVEIFRRFAETSTQGLAFLDRELNVMACNDTGARTIGYERGTEVVGLSAREISPELVSSGRSDAYMKVIATGVPFETESWIAFPRVGRIHLNVKAFQVADGLGLMFLDTTESKRIQESREVERRRLKTVIEGMPTFACLRTSDHGVQLANQRYVDLFGEPGEDPCYVELHGRGEPCEGCSIARVLETGRSESREWTAKNGRTYEITDVPIRGDETFVLQVGIDVTDRIQAEAALIACEKRFREMAEMLPEVVFECDLEGNLSFVNRIVHTRVGYTSEELVGGINVLHLLPPKDRERALRNLQRLIDGEASRGQRYTVVRADGTTIPTMIHAVVVRTDGSPTGLRGIAVDISEQEEARQALQTADEIVSSLPLGVLIYRCGEVDELRLEHGNPRVGRWITLEREVGRPLKAHWPADVAEELNEALRRVSREGIVYRKEIEIASPAKGTIAFRVHGFSLHGDRVAVALEDITDRRAAELALAHSEETYRSIFDCANDVILLHDAGTGEIVDANRKVEETFGYSVGDFLRLRVEEFSSGVPPYTQEEALRRIRAAANGDPQVFEWRFRKRNGQLFWGEVNLREVMPYVGRRAVVAVVRDASDRKALEAQLRQSQKLESLGTLASGVAHEINNPLMGMMNFAELIEDEVDGESTRHLIDGIRREGNRVAGIVRNLLSFARQDSEDRDVEAIQEAVETSLTLIRSVLTRDGILISVDVPDDLPQISCRRQQIEQVLLNLLTNARDALNERYPGKHKDKRIDVSAHVLSDSDGCWIRLTVADHGCGIPEQIRERLYDPFFTTKDRTHGTGLGLSISYGIVNDHGGRMSHHSEPGKTCFHVDLPTEQVSGKA